MVDIYMILYKILIEDRILQIQRTINTFSTSAQNPPLIDVEFEMPRAIRVTPSIFSYV